MKPQILCGLLILIIFASIKQSYSKQGLEDDDSKLESNQDVSGLANDRLLIRHTRKSGRAKPPTKKPNKTRSKKPNQTRSKPGSRTKPIGKPRSPLGKRPPIGRRLPVVVKPTQMSAVGAATVQNAVDKQQLPGVTELVKDISPSENKADDQVGQLNEAVTKLEDGLSPSQEKDDEDSEKEGDSKEDEGSPHVATSKDEKVEVQTDKVKEGVSELVDVNTQGAAKEEAKQPALNSNLESTTAFKPVEDKVIEKLGKEIKELAAEISTQDSPFAMLNSRVNITGVIHRAKQPALNSNLESTTAFKPVEDKVIEKLGKEIKELAAEISTQDSPFAMLNSRVNITGVIHRVPGNDTKIKYIAVGGSALALVVIFIIDAYNEVIISVKFLNSRVCCCCCGKKKDDKSADSEKQDETGRLLAGQRGPPAPQYPHHPAPYPYQYP